MTTKEAAVRPTDCSVVHWRHASGGVAACGVPNPSRFVSNDAMTGVTCPKCRRTFNRREPIAGILRLGAVDAAIET